MTTTTFSPTTGGCGCSQLRSSFEYRHLKFTRNRKFSIVSLARRRRTQSPIDKLKSNIDNKDSGATEPARLLLEKLFVQSQKLEEKISNDSRLSNDFELHVNLEVLEFDLNTALLALRRKEEDLQVAERKLVVDRAELKRAKEDLEKREEQLAIAHAAKKDMEEELKNERHDLASCAHQIESLKTLVTQQDIKIADLQSALSLREKELVRLRNNLVFKTEEMGRVTLELESRNRLLNEANGVIVEQKSEIQALQVEAREKEGYLAKLMHSKRIEKESLALAKAKLEKQGMEWSTIKEEVKKLAGNGEEQASVEFMTVKALLSDVEAELSASNESLSLSHSILDNQITQIERQVEEISDQKILVAAYSENLKNAQMELLDERTKLQAAEAQNMDAKVQLSTEKALVGRLKEELRNEKFHLKRAMDKIDSLLDELLIKETEFSDAQKLLDIKETELQQARLEIETLVSEKSSLQALLQEKDRELLRAHEILGAANNEALELQVLLKTKENQLIQSMGRMEEREDNMLAMQSELENTRHKFSEASVMIERIARLTSDLVSVKEEAIIWSHIGKQSSTSKMEDAATLEQHNKLKADLETTRELLKTKEMELLDSQRALSMKDEELKLVIKHSDAREKEMEKMKQLLCNSYGTKEIYELQLEIEAAATTLGRVLNMSNQLLKESHVNPRIADITTRKNVDTRNSSSTDTSHEELKLAERELTHLLALTENLVKDANMDKCTDFQARTEMHE